MPLDCIYNFGMLIFSVAFFLLNSSYTLHSSLKCALTTTGSLIGFGFSCWITTYNTKWFILNNDGTYSSYSHYGYYQDYDEDEMSDEISIPGLLAVEAFLLIGE